MYKIQYITLNEEKPIFTARGVFTYGDAYKAGMLGCILDEDKLCFKIVRIPDGS